MTLSDYASIATIGAFLVTLISLAFSAKRYLDIRTREEEVFRFKTYHRLLKTISKGSDENGILKLVSQVAYIYELRNFPEYKDLTKKTLNQLRKEWSHDEASDIKPLLKEAIDDTISVIEASSKYNKTWRQIVYFNG
ncbi:hypothetical protein [Sulfurospirillum sp. 1612]|uniref:hypothetical protein n=1 Tax=Sulfurospirillum sp. 1612 TaxID=3094835 RepID=UPI002F91E823